MMNILSFSKVAAKYRVTMDSAQRNEIRVHLNDGKLWRFSKMNCNYEIINYWYINLASKNEMSLNNRDKTNAKLAMKLYEHCNYPGYKHFMSFIKNNYFRNLPITVEDAKQELHK